MLAQGFCTMAGRDGGGRYYRCTTGVAFTTTGILHGADHFSCFKRKDEYPGGGAKAADETLKRMGIADLSEEMFRKRPSYY